MNSRRIVVAGLAALLLIMGSGQALADYPDWAAVADEKVIAVLTQDEDGDRRKTKVWFVLIEGEAYLRTNGSRWLGNLQRDPDLGLRINDREYEAKAEEISGEEIVVAVDLASREKYGWQERFIHVFRMKTPAILKLSPR